MSEAFKLLFIPISPFITHPERAWLVAGLFAILLAVSLMRTRKFTLRYHLIMGLAVISWIVFGRIEQVATASGWNIRVDLLLTVPLVLAASIGALWAGIRSACGGRERVPGG